MTQFSPYFINGFNFVFTFSFLVLIIIKKIIPSYRKQIIEEKELNTERLTLADILEKKKTHLIIVNDEQKSLIIQLHKKITDWRTGVEMQEEKKIKLLNHRRQNMHEKKEQLHEKLVLKKMHQQALEKSLLSVKTAIEIAFEDQNEKEAYLKNLCLYNLKKGF